MAKSGEKCNAIIAATALATADAIAAAADHMKHLTAPSILGQTLGRAYASVTLTQLLVTSEIGLYHKGNGEKRSNK